MKYYEGHESVYRRLAAEGESCWDRTAFDAFCMRPWLEDALARLRLAPGARVLEIGCGAGPISCFLAARGYDVLGLDVSATAIAMATQHAVDLGLSARFAVADVLAMDGDTQFDLVVDGHCLHCIVFDDERHRLLASIARRMAVGGAFVVETMARHPALRFDAPPGQAFELDDDGILWTTAPTRAPQRRVRAASELSAELRDSGLTFEHEEIGLQEIPNEPWNYRAILRR